MLISLALENNIIGTYTNFNNFLVVQKLQMPHLHHPVYATTLNRNLDHNLSSLMNRIIELALTSINKLLIVLCRRRMMSHNLKS
jgi:hypothetical protein